MIDGQEGGLNSSRTFELKKPSRLEFIGYDPNDSPTNPKGNMELTQDLKINKIPLERKRKETTPNIVSFVEDEPPIPLPKKVDNMEPARVSKEDADDEDDWRAKEQREEIELAEIQRNLELEAEAELERKQRKDERRSKQEK